MVKSLIHQFDKLVFNKLVNVSSRLNDLLTKVDDLDDDGNLKIVFVGWKRPRDVLSKYVLKETMYIKLNTKVNNLEKKLSSFYLNSVKSNNVDFFGEKKLETLIKKPFMLVL